jgi:hypothetical protein
VIYAHIFIVTTTLSVTVAAAEFDRSTDPLAAQSGPTAGEVVGAELIPAHTPPIQTAAHQPVEKVNSAPNNFAELPDFIIPFANDIRFGYSAHVGNYHRKQEYGENTQSDFLEHGLWLSYICALTKPNRVLSGQAEWRAETALLLSHAEVNNPNGSSGKLDVGSINLGVGPAWAISANANNRLEIEVLPFLGIGTAQYDNTYVSSSGNLLATTAIAARGMCVEYGIKANLMWCWSNGWGAAMHIGFVQRSISLKGDRVSDWEDGTTISHDYSSDDSLSGIRYGFFLARRF